jgi:hypothetical protein
MRCGNDQHPLTDERQNPTNAHASLARSSFHLQDFDVDASKPVDYYFYISEKARRG